MKEKDNYTPAGWKFPKEAEIFRIPMNGKYYTRERPNVRRSNDSYRLVAEFPLYGKPSNEAARGTWALAKKLAKEYLLHFSWMGSVIVSHQEPNRNTGRTYDTVCVYEKAELEPVSPDGKLNEQPVYYKIRFFSANGSYLDETGTFSKEVIPSEMEKSTTRVDADPERYAGWELFSFVVGMWQWKQVSDTARYDTGRRSSDGKVHEALKQSPKLPDELTIEKSSLRRK